METWGNYSLTLVDTLDTLVVWGVWGRGMGDKCRITVFYILITVMFLLFDIVLAKLTCTIFRGVKLSNFCTLRMI